MATPAKTADMKPFLFDRAFDDYGREVKSREQIAAEKAAKEAAENPEPAEPEIELIYSEDDIAAFKQEAYMDGHADGFREGQTEALETIEKNLNDLLERIVPLVGSLASEQKLANERAQANMARMVQALMSKLMPVYIRDHGADEALAVVSDCLAELQDAGRLTVFLSEETMDQLGERLDRVVQRVGFEGQFRVLADDTMGASDIRVDWGAGGAERHYDSIRGEIDAAIDRAVSRVEAEIAEREEAKKAALENAETDLDDEYDDDETGDPADTRPSPSGEE